MREAGPAAPQAGDQYVQSLARGLAVIRAFDANNPHMTLSEVAARTGLTRATARRFLHTLVELGYVRTDGKTFALTALVLQLGYSYLSALTLPSWHSRTWRSCPCGSGSRRRPQCWMGTTSSTSPAWPPAAS